MPYLIKIIALFWLLIGVSIADVVKPALVEISIYSDKKVTVVIDLTLEAAMTGIGTQYKKTTDAPSSTQYDTLRSLTADDLREQFKIFEAEFLSHILLTINEIPRQLTLISAKIDIVGYKKRPRKTLLTYSTQLSKWPKTLSWQYNKAYGDSALRYQVYKEGEYNWSQWRWLRNGAPSDMIDINYPEPMTTMQRMLQFVSIGFDHVIPLGWDHILFIIGTALSSLVWRRLLLLVSAFTLAHTLTLGLAMLGIVEISGRIIEPLIAFSIAYVAIENLLPNQSIKRKSIIVFLFGLVHGLGFASMLKGFKMSSDNFLTTLISFNVGVELAQIVIVSSVVLILFFIKSLNLDYKKIAIIPTSIVIALIGSWWGINRLIG
ncbi:HupE/UreJ family protein [Candidatus Ruthia endofausta]|uniref:HupE/UreJ family protein n=1 Tax=Candidatus Ruthia endofausta TaxID=2738852 RepID=A0A6N0HQR6_9GAMM|nr:HupE/UreJ family protein [Candidatus Ruthia endofausta]QKQ24752.1 HupE/UreJ family protein [Candidatus Ruthia endofausta]